MQRQSSLRAQRGELQLQHSVFPRSVCVTFVSLAAFSWRCKLNPRLGASSEGVVLRVRIWCLPGWIRPQLGTTDTDSAKAGVELWSKQKERGRSPQFLKSTVR